MRPVQEAESHIEAVTKMVEFPIHVNHGVDHVTFCVGRTFEAGDEVMEHVVLGRTVSTSMTSTEVSCGRTWSPLSPPPSSLMPISMAPPATPSRKSLSAKIEAKTSLHLLDPSFHESHCVAHFCLNRIPGAGAWLFALPDSLESHIPALLFRISLRRPGQLRFEILRSALGT